MMTDYRFNVRFDTRNEAERQAAEFLRGMKRGSRNRFVIEAIAARMNGGIDKDVLVDTLREVIRDELRSIPLAVSKTVEASAVGLTELTPEEQEANQAAALAALDEFF